MNEDISSSSQFSTANTTYFNLGDITLRQWNLPATFGMEFEKGRIIYGLETSAIFNLSFQSEGKVQIGEIQFSNFKNENLYKSSLGFGWSGAFLLGRNLSDSNSIFIKPTYTKYVGNTNDLGSDIQSNLNFYYLEVSNRYRF